ncbi:hypothetical protein KAR91_10105 [Candidatus Pacearchaeota archaeon]|nr:hypothetical protein [Candidatus Pacearchaeota archaeon]
MMKNIWAQVTEHLDDDERLVWPRMYFENRKLYDQVRAVVYIIRYAHPTTGEIYYDWVKPDSSKLDDGDEIIARVLLVRLALPWNTAHFMDTITQEELEEFRGEYDVLDVFVRVVDKTTGTPFTFVSLLKFQANRDLYEVVETRFLVSLKYSNEAIKEYMGYLPVIAPHRVHTWMEK